MRVLQISWAYSGGGAERCARELLHNLPVHGIKTSLWTALQPTDSIEHVWCFRKPWERYLNLLETVPHLTDWRHRGAIAALDGIGLRDFDLVHLHTIHNGVLSIKAVHRLCQRLPVVWTLHDQWAATGTTGSLDGLISARDAKKLTSGPMRYIPYHPYHPNFRNRGVNRFLEKWVPQPRALISPSNFVANQVQRSGRMTNTPVHVIPNAVAILDTPDRLKEQSEARQLLGLPENAFIVVMVASAVTQPHKGFLWGIQAIRSLPSDIDWFVLLLGHAADSLAKSLPAGRAKGTYASSDAQLAWAYRAADVTLIPSLVDNFPYAALESLACERPFVSFAIGGLPEIAGEDQSRGLLASAFDVHQLQQHLIHLAHSPAKRNSLGQAGAAWVEKECAPNRYIQRVANLYQEIISTKISF